MDPFTLSMLAAGGSGLLTKLLNPGKSYTKAQQQNEKYYNQGQGYLQPYAQQGQEAYGQLNGAMQNLLNPSQLHDQWANNYQASDAARFAQERAREQGLQAASSMGLMGSSPALQSIQAGTAQIGAEDEQRYIDRMIQQYLQGAGIAQNIYGQGANASGQLGQNAMMMGQSSAENAFGAQQAPGGLFSNLLGNAATLGAGYYGMKGMNNSAGAWNPYGGKGSPPMATPPIRQPMSGGY